VGLSTSSLAAIAQEKNIYVRLLMDKKVDGALNKLSIAQMRDLVKSIEKKLC
jgi:hypothetical protein